MILNGFGTFFAFVAFSMLFAVAALVTAFICQPKDSYPNKTTTYECGMEPIGDGQSGFSIKYYMYAILFIIFEVEALFLFPWAVVFKRLGFFALMEAFIFIAILFLGLFYAWKKNLLEWR